MNTPASTTASTTSATTSANKALIIGLPAAVVIAAAIGYFAVVPMMQVNAQKNLAAKHKAVADKMDKVYDSFKRDVFTKTDEDSSAAKIDVKVAQDAVKDARAELDANAAALTKFRALPLLGWNKQYAAATQADRNEETYIAKSRTLLNDYQGLLTFTDQNADLGTKVEASVKQLDTLSENDTPEQVAAKLDATTAQLQPLVDQARKLTAPAFVQDENTAELKDADAIIADFKQMAAAARQLDVAKITAASDNLTKTINDSDTREKAFFAKLHTDSPIQKQIDALHDLDTTISRDYGRL
jgi:hypothetical protein